MNGEIEYLRLLKYILENGVRKENRTGIAALTVPHMMLQHDMSLGFPLITTKKVAFKPIRVELEFFIKGLTDKKWLQDRGCQIWNEWANPMIVLKRVLNEKYPFSNVEEGRKKIQKDEIDLGKIYGYQWRNFNSQKYGNDSDQLKNIVHKLHKDPNDRRMICSAWNPIQLSEMALPPCHVLWHVTHIEGTLHLSWFQRSCDFLLGIPFNFSSYALLLHLLCKESGFKEGLVTGFLSDCHIYENHIEQVKEQISRTPYELPKIETEKFTSIFDWTWEDTKSVGYKSHDKIIGEVAI